MTMCRQCITDKPASDFSRGKINKDQKTGLCKPCNVIEATNRKRTIKGLVKMIYQNQRMTTKKMGRPQPSYTEPELYDWMISNGLQPLHKTWVDSGYDKWLSPSVDRLDNKKAYTFDNMQLITWRENLENQKRHNIEGIHLHPVSKKVAQFTLEGDLVKTWLSAGMAARDIVGNNKNVSNITNVCSGKAKSAYGYKWEFVN